MQARTIAWPTRWTANSLATTHPVTTTVRACVAPLLVFPKRLGHILAFRTRAPTPAHRPDVLQPPCPYAMLVSSDVRKGIEGLLP
jgi:hypothetical protein